MVMIFKYTLSIQITVLQIYMNSYNLKFFLLFISNALQSHRQELYAGLYVSSSIQVTQYGRLLSRRLLHLHKIATGLNDNLLSCILKVTENEQYTPWLFHGLI